MTGQAFVDLAISDDNVVLCGAELARPSGVDAKSWRALWDRAHAALARRGSMRDVERRGDSSMDIFRRMAGRADA